MSLKELFNHHLKQWREETGILSTGIFENQHFNSIVEMREDAVPFIIEEIRNKPDHLVHALDLIYPGKVKYSGCVPLEKACKTWINIIEGQEI